MQFFTDVYHQKLNDSNAIVKYDIKWDRELESYLKRNITKQFDVNKIVPSLYRPFVKQSFYFDRHFNGMTYQWNDLYNVTDENRIIGFISGIAKPFSVLSNGCISDCRLMWLA